MTKQETTTGKELVAFSLWQDGVHLDGKAPKEYADKMIEIVNRAPDGTWTGRGFDLLEAAIKELAQVQEVNEVEAYIVN